MKLVLAAVGAVAIVVSGCSTGAATPAASGSASAGGAGKTLVIVHGSLQSPFHQALKDGFTKRAEELGYTVKAQGPTKETDVNEQVNQVEALIQEKPAGIVIAPEDATKLQSAVKAANAARVPVFFVNTIQPIGGDANVTSYISYNQWQAGIEIAQAMCKVLGNAGKTYVIQGALATKFYVNRRTQGYEAGLKASCPNVQIVGEQPADWLRDKAITVATAALQKDPDIKGFFGNSDEMAIGASLAADQLGIKGINTFGIDGNQATLDLIQQGKVTGTATVFPAFMGATAADVMDKVARGEKVDQVVETPSAVIDASNIADFLAGKLTPPPAKAGKFEEDNGQP